MFPCREHDEKNPEADEPENYCRESGTLHESEDEEGDRGKPADNLDDKVEGELLQP
jgi:hypothetical protein